MEDLNTLKGRRLIAWWFSNSNRLLLLLLQQLKDLLQEFSLLVSNLNWGRCRF